MTSEKYPLTGIDLRCIFPGYIGCPNTHCENCWVFHKEKHQTPVLQYYRLWYAYLQANGEVPESISKRRYYSGGGKVPKEKMTRINRRLAVKSSKRCDIEVNHPRWKVKPSRQEVALNRPRLNGLFLPKQEGR